MKELSNVQKNKLARLNLELKRRQAELEAKFLALVLDSTDEQIETQNDQWQRDHIGNHKMLWDWYFEEVAKIKG